MADNIIKVRIGSWGLLDELQDCKRSEGHPGFYQELRLGVNRLTLADAIELHNEADYQADRSRYDMTDPYDRGRWRSWCSIRDQLRKAGVPMTESDGPAVIDPDAAIDRAIGMSKP